MPPRGVAGAACARRRVQLRGRWPREARARRRRVSRLLSFFGWNRAARGPPTPARRLPSRLRRYARSRSVARFAPTLAPGLAPGVARPPPRFKSRGGCALLGAAGCLRGFPAAPAFPRACALLRYAAPLPATPLRLPGRRAGRRPRRFGGLRVGGPSRLRSRRGAALPAPPACPRGAAHRSRSARLPFADIAPAPFPPSLPHRGPIPDRDSLRSPLTRNRVPPAVLRRSGFARQQWSARGALA